MQLKAGFDNISGDREQDDLDRWRFALDICEVIDSTPRDWSVRIGLFGRWGSGKSTILKYIGERFASQDDIVIFFAPSFETNFSDAIGAFGAILFEELRARELIAEPKAKGLFRRFEKVTREGTAKAVVDSSSEFWKGAKLLSAGFGALSLWLRHSAAEIKRVIEQFPNRRFVVLIDDLDRTSAELLPKFLLSLREVLDLPGFSFVLAFDDSIVARSLKKENPEWEGGQDFLQKILDFRFSLPPVGEKDKLRLLSSALTKFAPFVPFASAEEVTDLIPENPREIKALVRGLLSTKSVIQRHGQDEFKWTDVWLVQLMRQESLTLLETLTNESVFNNMIGTAYHFLHKTEAGSGKAKADPVEQLLDKIGITEPKRERLLKLIEAMRSRGSSQLGDVVNWSRRQPALTWMEFDEIVTELGYSPDDATAKLSSLLQRHASKREIPLDDVFEDFVRTVDARTRNILEKSRWSTRADQIQETYREVAPYRALTRTFFDIPRALNPARFGLLYDQAQYWAAVSGGTVEREARNDERTNLLHWAGKLDEASSLDVYTRLHPWFTESVDHPFGETDAHVALRNEVAGVLYPTVDGLLLKFLSRESCIQRLAEPGQNIAFKGLIFGSAPNWSEDLTEALRQTFRPNVAGLDSYANAEAFVSLASEALRHRHADIGASAIAQFAKDDVIMQTIWTLVTSRSLLPRGIVVLLILRERLIQAGVNEESLQLNEQLRSQWEYFDKNRQRLLNQA